jgi:hypothetical protein
MSVQPNNIRVNHAIFLDRRKFHTYILKERDH